MSDLNKNISDLANMYSDFLVAAYKRLINGGFAEEMARVTAMQMLKEHMAMSAEIAISKNRTMSDILSGVKGGSA